MTGRPGRDRPAVDVTLGILLACLIAACSILVTDPPVPVGSRQWIITVENSSGQPAALFVALDESPMGRVVGTAVPSTVAAGVTQRVLFTVPPGQGWALFVNPSPVRGPLILAQDVPPTFSGDFPGTIHITPSGIRFSPRNET